jgi:hypothetical protein
MGKRIIAMMLGMLALAACGGAKSAGDAGTDGDGDGDTDTDSETETETDSDTLLPAPECAEDGDCQGPLICNELWGLCVVATCAEQDNFVPCETVTDPDRAYDICIRGVCQSPGCGTVDCNPPGPHFPLGDSNQRYCCGDGEWATYGEAILDECPAPGEDYYGQDAQFGWDTLHDHSERYTRSVPVPDEPIVEDHATGLIWQGCGSTSRGADCEIDVTGGSLQWKQAIAHCDALAWGGFHDWRLPDRFELESLVMETGTVFFIDDDAFPYSGLEWTLSRSAEEWTEYGSAFVAWYYHGAIYNQDIYKDSSARCVRGVPNPRPRARWERDTAIVHQPVVHDHATGLVWQGCPKGLGGDDCQLGSVETTTWKGAFETCAFLSSLGWGGRDDWRVPSRHELSSIVDDRFFEPALDPEAFDVTYYDDTWGGTTWTSTSVKHFDDAPEARTVSLATGGLFNGGLMPKFSSTAELRCVAGGQ